VTVNLESPKTAPAVLTAWLFDEHSKSIAKQMSKSLIFGESIPNNARTLPAIGINLVSARGLYGY
jgi:hypothetical protein